MVSRYTTHYIANADVNMEALATFEYVPTQPRFSGVRLEFFPHNDSTELSVFLTVGQAAILLARLQSAIAEGENYPRRFEMLSGPQGVKP